MEISILRILTRPIPVILWLCSSTTAIRISLFSAVVVSILTFPKIFIPRLCSTTTGVRIDVSSCAVVIVPCVISVRSPMRSHIGAVAAIIPPHKVISLRISPFWHQQH